jgi:two-component system chemotaxis sensor kinase CheA
VKTFLKFGVQPVDKAGMDFGAPVLIIDDDPAAIDAVKEVLEAAGHSTAVARDGFHGLRLVREVKPSVIVCDMVMPNMAGSDVFRTLAADPSTAHIPRVLMSGHSDADRSCADGFLLKPFEAHDMLELLGRVASNPRTPTKGRTSREAHWRG